MKKVLVITFVLLFIICITAAGSAQAATISFGDTGPYYWPGYPSSSSTINNTEHWGIPDITGGTATFTGSSLTGVTINMTKILPRYNWLYEGDLFIDLGGDKTWDYIVSNYASSYQTTGDPDDQGATWKLYQVTSTVNLSDSWFYIYSHNFGGSGTIRDGHPIEVDPQYADSYLGEVSIPDVAFTGVVYSDNPTFVSWSWDATDIDIGGEAFILGWAISCANDNLYTPVPLPGAALLLGSGLFGLAGLRRKFSS